MASKAKKKVTEGLSKKEKKKDKKKSKEPSITDVIAVELMEKAKKTLGNDAGVKKEGRTPSPPPAPLLNNQEPVPPTPPRINTPPASDKEPEDDDYNIATISENRTANTKGLHKKELSQLQELQNRIYETKRKLRDFDSDSDKELPVARNSVMSRLGVKPTENSKPSNIISLSAIRKTEKEVYIAPSFRKLIERQKAENDRREEGPRRTRTTSSRRDRRSRTRSRSRSRDHYRSRRERSRSPIRRSRSPKTRPSIHQRIGSRVVVASPEKEAPVKAKHRPLLSSSTSIQAGKNLLLRAVAEAQRSIAFAPVEQRKRAARDNIVVQLPARKDKRNIRMEEEYVPESISTQSESEAEYRPTKGNSQDDGDDGDVIYLNNNEDVDLEDLDNDESRKSPQFVVTLEGATHFDKRSKSSHSPTPPPVIKRKSIKDRIGVRPSAAVTKPNWEERQPVKRKLKEESESQRAYNRARRARLSPIKFDLTDEEEEEDNDKSRNSSKERGSETNGQAQSEGRNDEQNGEEHAKRIKLEPSRSFDHLPPRKKTLVEADSALNKFFNFSVLSAITIPVQEPSKPIVKSKERCKYYPLCSNVSCNFYHPTLPCKLFPNCKFGDSCAYVHPRCKFDTSCARIDCNFSHSQAAAPQSLPPVGELKTFQINAWIIIYQNIFQHLQLFLLKTSILVPLHRASIKSASSFQTARTQIAHFYTRKSAGLAKDA